MSRSLRLGLFVLAVLGFAAVYGVAVSGLRPVGHYSGPYGDVLNSLAVYQRHATDVVSAINFDYRGFDTLGEEFILFGSVMGVLLLLRRLGDEKLEARESALRPPPPPSDAMRTLTLGLLGPMIVFGVYIVLHGQLTPGGGFQGGVVLASAPLLVYLSGSLEEFERVTSPKVIEAAEAVGAGGFALLGVAGLLAGTSYLQNILPFGHTGQVFSSGTILLISALTGLEVTAGFVLALREFLEHALTSAGDVDGTDNDGGKR